MLEGRFFHFSVAVRVFFITFADKLKEMKLPSLLIIMASALVLSACSKKKTADVIIVDKPLQEQPAKTQATADFHREQDVAWLGSHYRVVVDRSADRTLPLAEADENHKFYDNRITLTILRGDGSKFFSRAFTKADFDGYLPADVRGHGALIGLVFDSAGSDALTFVASVGNPDPTSDEYVPLRVRVSRLGAVTISRDTRAGDAGGADGV